MKKTLIIILAFFAAVSAYAQKPVNVAVWKDISAPALKTDRDASINNLLWEYFKSELASHAGLKVVQNDALSKRMAESDFEAGKAFTPAQIKDICSKAGADIFAAISVRRNSLDSADGKEGYKLTANVVLYNADGTEKAKLKRMFGNVRQSELTSVILARDAALAIRGESAVDDINLQREKRLVQELQEYSQTDKGKLESDIKAIK